jgi:hypothetical protein
MADAADSKSADRKVVKVRLLSPARYLWHFSKICLLQGFSVISLQSSATECSKNRCFGLSLDTLDRVKVTRRVGRSPCGAARWSQRVQLHLHNASNFGDTRYVWPIWWRVAIFIKRIALGRGPFGRKALLSHQGFRRS